VRRVILTLTLDTTNWLESHSDYSNPQETVSPKPGE